MNNLVQHLMGTVGTVGAAVGDSISMFLGKANLPLDQSHSIVDRKENSVNARIILAESVELSQRNAVGRPVGTGLLCQIWVGISRDSHSPSKYSFLSVQLIIGRMIGETHRCHTR